MLIPKTKGGIEMYLVKYETCEQVSPDDFRMIWKEKIVTEDTTIGEVVEWLRRNERIGKNDKRFFPEIKLTRPDKKEE